MAIVEAQPMTAVDNTNTVRGHETHSQTVAFSIVSSAAAAFAIALEASWDDGANWKVVTYVKPDQTTGTSATAVGDTGWQRVPSATHCRLRCTSITTPGAGVVTRISLSSGI